MTVAYLPIFIQDKYGRHAPKFEKVDFLLELVGNLCADIRAADERQIIFLPIALKGMGPVRPKGDDLSAAGLK